MATSTLIHVSNKENKLQCRHFNIESKKIFGFWIYLMSDCILFCCLFITYIILMNNTAGGVTGRDIFKIPFVLIETVLLLLSSIACSMSSLYICSNKKHVLLWLLLTWLFASCFIGMETYEFQYLIKKGVSPNRSGFLSALFTIVSAHSLHVISGLIWIIVLMFQIFNQGLSNTNYIRVTCLNLFWHFLDIIWICMFSVVYLIGII